jgi:hypothetical protein
MTDERDGGEKSSGFERVKQELLVYFEGEPLGSVKHTAFFDYFSHEDYMGRWRDKIEDLSKKTESDNPAQKEEVLSLRSQIQIYEFKIAGLEREIDVKSTTIPGYQKAQLFIEDMLGNLYDAIETEEEENGYPTETDEQIDTFSRIITGRYNAEVEQIKNELINHGTNFNEDTK